MPELIEQMYCSQQIVIPPKFPYVLKRYAKVFQQSVCVSAPSFCRSHTQIPRPTDSAGLFADRGDAWRLRLQWAALAHLLAAIKTQPYDLLRWSHEYFKALVENRTPPVKLRLEYPIYSTEGGLTRGYLKVLALQLEGTDPVPLPLIKYLWRGSCLEAGELRRALCLCGAHRRADAVPRLTLLAVVAGLLTKSLTHTMILLCETLTKEPDGGSAAVPVEDFLMMYRFLAAVDASRDVKYYDGVREGDKSKTESLAAEEDEVETIASGHSWNSEGSSDEYWVTDSSLQRVSLIDARVPRAPRLSLRLSLHAIGQFERSPSAERASQIERENYMRERKGRAVPNQDVEDRLRELSGAKITSKENVPDEHKSIKIEEPPKDVEIMVYDEDDNPVALEFYGEPKVTIVLEEDLVETGLDLDELEEQVKEEEKIDERERIVQFVEECFLSRKERLEDLTQTFEDIAVIVDRYKSANYDLSMVAGRQMSTTSGEFIVHQIERDIMDYIGEQIAVLPDPDLKKKKAKPEEVAMIRDLLERFLDDNMDVIVPELEEVEEEEAPIPEITIVYAVPGIGPPVDDDIVREFTEYALEVSKTQAEVFMPRNIRHFLCPPLEKLPECNYEIDMKKVEEVPTGGVITD